MHGHDPVNLHSCGRDMNLFVVDLKANKCKSVFSGQSELKMLRITQEACDNLAV